MIIKDYRKLTEIYLGRWVLGTFFASTKYAMIAQSSEFLSLDKEIPPESKGQGAQGFETDKDLPIINKILSNVNEGIDRTNLRSTLLDKIDSPIHIFSVSAAALLLFLFLWFVLKSY